MQGGVDELPALSGFGSADGRVEGEVVCVFRRCTCDARVRRRHARVCVHGFENPSLRGWFDLIDGGELHCA